MTTYNPFFYVYAFWFEVVRISLENILDFSVHLEDTIDGKQKEKIEEIKQWREEKIRGFDVGNSD